MIVMWVTAMTIVFGAGFVVGWAVHKKAMISWIDKMMEEEILDDDDTQENDV